MPLASRLVLLKLFVTSFICCSIFLQVGLKKTFVELPPPFISRVEGGGLGQPEPETFLMEMLSGRLLGGGGGVECLPIC